MAKKNTSERMSEAVRNSLRSSGFSKILVGVSGGADSVALLLLLRDAEADVMAAHCNFHLRGEESRRDENYVRSLCSSLSIPLLSIDFDVDNHMAQHPGISLEMACRELRYDWFFSLLRTRGFDRVAIAHNADDNAETLFLNLLRGSGTTGLKGMVSDTGKVWRPLLDFHRSEIETYLSEQNIPFIVDSSNLSSDYRRNFLRNEVFPLLKSRWPGFDKAVASTLSFMRAENQVVEQALEQSLPDPGEPLDTETVLNFAAPELLVRRFITPLSPFTTTASEVVNAMKAEKPDVRRWRLKGGSLELRNRKLFLKKDV